MALFPIRIIQLELEWLADVALPFFHQPVMSGFLRTLYKPHHQLREVLQNRVLLHTPESGCTHYTKGSRYQLELILLGVGEAALVALFDLFANLPYSAKHAGCKGQLSDNVRLIGLRDGLRRDVITHPLQSTPLSHALLLDEAEQWQAYGAANPVVTLQFLSPLRLSQDKAVRAQSNDKDATLLHSGDALTAELVHQRLFDAYAALCANLELPRPTRSAMPAQPPAQNKVFWADCFYQSGGQRKSLGGLLGTINLPCQPLSLDTWYLLVLAQYIGLGQNRNFGLGRLRLVGQHGEAVLPPTSRSTPLLHRVFSRQALQQAWQHEVKKLPAVKRPSSDEDCDALYHQLLNGTYQASPLNARRLEKPAQAPRLLLLPPFIDKVAHKALSTWLSASLDTLYSKHSYAYRKGYSRFGAKTRVQHLLRQGHVWLVDADIKRFFASLNPADVLQRLIALYGDDPLWQVLHTMLSAPLAPSPLLQSTTPTGLNLGNSLSPVLANLMLDDFDAQLHAFGIEQVRYADDFLLLCKTEQAAQHAKHLVEQLLATQGLTLNTDKTKIVHIKQGVRFLGQELTQPQTKPLRLPKTIVSSSPKLGKTTAEHFSDYTSNL